MSALRRLRIPLALLCLLGARSACAAPVPASVLERLGAGEAVELIVEYEAATVEEAAERRRAGTPGAVDDAATLAFRAQAYDALKRTVDREAAHAGTEHLRDYSHLPMAFKRFRSAAALERFAAHPGVKAVYENLPLRAVTAQSLPLVGQPAVASAGEKGAGTTVAVIDNGIDYTHAAFGACTAPGVPGTCRVSVALDFGTGNTDHSHGTNVSAIVLGVAPEARIAALNAFSGTVAYTADVIDAINWTIPNRAAHNIVALNMSLGDGVKYTAACSSGNPFSTPVENARNAGMTVVAAAGNEGYTNGIARPACTPGAVSVGAVYDANVGGLNWGLCTDAATSADKVTCFSDSAGFLTMLAPGALIAAAGLTMGGTSQASPHVAGAVAVLRSTFPGETLDQTQARLTGSGVSVTDARNGIAKPRLNLLEAARPANDAFAGRLALAGSTGSTSGVSLLATREAGEPNHGGNGGAHSVWWKWSAPAAGQVALDTLGSGFDTLLAVYTGSAVAALAPVATNDNEGGAGGSSGLLFQAQAGVEYAFAVDGANGSAGSAALHWSLNTAAQANLSVSLSGPGSVTAGANASYTLTAANAGPQAATNVRVTLALPAGASYVSGSPGCSENGGVVTCELGQLAGGASVPVTIELLWNAIDGGATLSAGVASDLPDPITPDNSAAVQVAAAPAADADVPTLPEWGVLLLAALLLGAAAPRRR